MATFRPKKNTQSNRVTGEAKIYVNGLLDTTASASQTINDAGTTDITIGNQVIKAIKKNDKKDN